MTLGEPTSPLVTTASIGVRLVISEGFTMYQFSVTIPRLDDWSSSKTGRALGPSEAKSVVFHKWGDLVETPLYQAWVGAPTPKGVGPGGSHSQTAPENIPSSGLRASINYSYYSHFTDGKTEAKWG